MQQRRERERERNRYGVPAKREMRTCWSVCAKEPGGESFESTRQLQSGQGRNWRVEGAPSRSADRSAARAQTTLHRHVNGIPNGHAENYIRRETRLVKKKEKKKKKKVKGQKGFAGDVLSCLRAPLSSRRAGKRRLTIHEALNVASVSAVEDARAWITDATGNIRFLHGKYPRATVKSLGIF